MFGLRPATQKEVDFVYSGLYIGSQNIARTRREGMQNGILYTDALTEQEATGHMFLDEKPGTYP